MALISTVPYEKAEGTIKQGYDLFLKKIGVIPRPLEMMSVSPALFELHLRRIEYLSRHPALSFALLAHIRYLVAKNLDYGFCMDLNRHILNKLGVEDAEIRTMESDPSKSLLEENESAMLVFVVKAVKAPDSVSAEEIQRLKDMGWTERDMVDAMVQGVSMIDHAIMMRVFRMDQSCMAGCHPGA